MRTVNWITVLVLVYAGVVCAFMKPDVSNITTAHREENEPIISNQGSNYLPEAENQQPLIHKTVSLQQVR